ncbi:MAG TPA: CHC2 zinc finger domain-containing protein [Leptospiraceae bacterium]|jgi:DNA primase catalytic core|nr:CHC2 zinc finger domain-containing protein [Leptospiraceae bacterium]HMW58028.1 CHC2 zinc finger domain-containing protein [Leptospiraceae bacterium]HMY43828.1 CHC2 zinc finger domain-containing protein [Leptospiraceae bacterium]HMZ35848.1 CHC2 zinc finger domain-containing protein [Leptospiraceae bacterium]HNJ02647.1 CHC2 zinc finger domain-containing protein [Leptospiraceae bacterium]
MPIPSVEIARLKASVDLAALARSRGIRLKSVGKDLMGLCPFHAERTASFSITPSANLFHCLGCGSGGSPIDFIMKLDGVDFLTAIRTLRGGTAANHHREISGFYSEDSQMIRNTDQSESPLLDPENQRILKYVIQYYAKTLESSEVAWQYMMSRKLVHPDLASTFLIGYSDGTLLAAIPSQSTEEGSEIRARLFACGILRKQGAHFIEHMRDRIVVPIMDVDGIIQQLYGRKLPGGGSTSTDHMYLPFSKNCVFHPRAFISQTLIVCEGPLDALSFFCAGIRNVSCTYSATDIPPAFLDATEKGNVRRVLIAFDSDEAGDRGAARFADLLGERGIASARMKYPAHSGEDR